MRREYFILFTAFLFLIVATTVRSGDRPTLLVLDHKSKEIILKEPFAYGHSFTIRYIHSVDRSPVFEVFTAEKGEGLVLKETYFRMFGAGMGHWEGHGKIVQEDGWIKIQAINRSLETFILRVGSPEVAHTILMDEREWNLSQIAPGRRVVIMISEE
ncbi:MAG: DUF1850 domain-containing protein [Deltaproteobacteria bacterium]|nr:DUF1850 domain-containing protein [Deltaproteobacteria bacterium]